MPNAATFPDDPAGAEGGEIGSWQGAEFRHGLSNGLIRGVDVDGVEATGLGESSDFGEPQQHDAPRHFGPHLQALAWESASNGCATDTVAARLSPPIAQASTSAIAGERRPARQLLGEWEGMARMKKSGPFAPRWVAAATSAGTSPP